MEVIVGTSAGVFFGAERATGLDERVVRQIIQVDGSLLAAASDGVYRSRDGGRRWNRLGVDAGEVWNLGVSPHEDRLIYAGTQPAHLFVSDDGGDSWQEVQSFLGAPGAEKWCVPGSTAGARALALAFDPFNRERMWVGVEVGGVMCSSDAGASWSVSEPCGNADIHVLAPHPARAGVLFATTGFGRNDNKTMDPRMAGPYRSDDGGSSWQYLGGGMGPHYTRAMCVDPRPPHVLTIPAVPDVRSSVRDAGGAQSVLYRSEDEGLSWRTLGDEAHSPSPARITAVGPDPGVLNGVVIGTETGEVWRVGPGAEWTLLCDGLPAVQTVLALE
jgi:photosystem II stability/assembly factor-like uncharacterized protein